MTKIFFPKEATIKIDASGDVSTSASTVLDTAFASASTITGQFKDISITVPNADVEIVNLMGVTSSFQNAEIQENPAPLAEISGTIVVPGDEIMELEVWGSGTAAGGTHTTRQPGLATRTKLALLINLDDGTDEVNISIDDAYMTEYSPSMGSDDHAEASVTFKCLPKNFFIQWKD